MRTAQVPPSLPGAGALSFLGLGFHSFRLKVNLRRKAASAYLRTEEHTNAPHRATSLRRIV
jgi:hypothetical protein